MSVQKIIQESVDKNPLGLKEALQEELRARVRLALEAKMKDDEEDEWEDDEEDDEDEKCESVEQIDEISKKTLGSYIRKASYQNYDIGTEIGKRRTEPTTSANYQRQSKLLDKLAKRSTGIATATRKLTQEETEE